MHSTESLSENPRASPSAISGLIHRSVLEAVCRSDLAAPYITGLALLNAHNASNAPVRHERSQLGDSRYSLAQLFALTKIVFTAAFRMRLGAGNENPTEAVHYRIAETIGISAPGPTPREAEPRTAMKEPSNKPTEPSGIAGVYQRIFSLRTYWQLDAVLIALYSTRGFRNRHPTHPASRKRGGQPGGDNCTGDPRTRCHDRLRPWVR